MAEVTTLISMRDICKSFGPVRALDEVCIEVEQGEVHALVGENGAGKSTLMKILSGALTPDSGTIHLAGKPFRPAGPIESRRAGVAMIYQELTLAPHLTVEANVMLGIEAHRLGWLDLGSMKRRVREIFEFLHHPEIDPDSLVSDLGVGEQQLVELARALVTEASVVVMDEPTSSLSGRDTERLFEVIDLLKGKGVSVIYISHFLEEVRRVADRFTVLRDGKSVGSGEVASTTSAEIIRMMVGRQLDQMFPRLPHERGEPVLTVKELAGDPLPEKVDLELHKGEILGVAGLVGSGRTETVRALFGLDRVTSGKVVVFDRADSGAPTWTRIKQGIGMLSENRKEEGLAQGLDLSDNIALSNFAPYTRAGILSLRRQRAGCEKWMERLEIKASGPGQVVSDLSGGNQQKAAIARLLNQDADILLLDEPTRGIDVGSKIAIYHLIGELAVRGRAILYISSYLPELMGICDRIAVMHRGRVVDVREREAWSEESLMACCVGSDLKE